MDLKAVVISGEAPESDDDETLSIKTVSLNNLSKLWSSLFDKIIKF